MKSKVFKSRSEADIFAKKVRIGDEVIVVRGRKVPKMTTGKVFWMGKRYNQYRREYENRVGIEKADGEKIFLQEEYVLPVNWKDRLIHGKKRKDYIRMMLSRLCRSTTSICLHEGGDTQMRMNSRAFTNREDAERYREFVHGGIEITTDDKLNKTYIVFWPST